MNDQPNKADRDSPEALPQSSVIGKPRPAARKPKRQPKTDRRRRPLIVLGYPLPGVLPLGLRSSYGSPELMEYVSRCFAKTARVLREAAGLESPPRPRGRPREVLVDRAVPFYLAGLRNEDLAAAAIPDFDKLSRWRRKSEAKHLQEACKMRARRARKKHHA